MLRRDIFVRKLLISSVYLAKLCIRMAQRPTMYHIDGERENGSRYIVIFRVPKVARYEGYGSL